VSTSAPSTECATRLEPLRRNRATVNGGAVDVAAHSVPLQIQDMINNHNILPSPLSLSLSDCTVTGASPNATATCGTKGVFRKRFTLDEKLAVPGDSSRPFDNVVEELIITPTTGSSINGEYFLWPGNYPHAEHRRTVFWDNLNLSRTQMMRACGPMRQFPLVERRPVRLQPVQPGGWQRGMRPGGLFDGNVGQPDYKALGFHFRANPPSPFCGFRL